MGANSSRSASERTSVRELLAALEAASWSEVLRSLMHRTGAWAEWLCREQQWGRLILFFAVPYLAIFGMVGLLSSALPLAGPVFALSMGLAVGAAGLAVAHFWAAQTSTPA